MDYSQAHKEFLQLIKLENTSTVEPEEFQQYFNYAQNKYAQDNFASGSDSKQVVTDNIQHLRVYTDSSHFWKGQPLKPINPNGNSFIDLFTEWDSIYKDADDNNIKAPKYLRLEGIQAQILYGLDDPCKRTGLSKYQQVFNLKAGQRGYILRSSLRGVSNDKIYYHLAGNKIVFKLFGLSTLNSVKIEFYRFPVDIAYNSGGGSQSENSPDYPDYNLSSAIINPELNDEDTRLILKFAARNYLEGVQSPRIQTFN